MSVVTNYDDLSRCLLIKLSKDKDAEIQRLRAINQIKRREKIELKSVLDFIWNQRSKMRAESDKMWAESDKMWAEAILKLAGNIKTTWYWRPEKGACACQLETGEIFEPLS